MRNRFFRTFTPFAFPLLTHNLVHSIIDIAFRLTKSLLWSLVAKISLYRISASSHWWLRRRLVMRLTRCKFASVVVLLFFLKTKHLLFVRVHRLVVLALLADVFSNWLVQVVDAFFCLDRVNIIESVCKSTYRLILEALVSARVGSHSWF